jgi:hypothetical protein
VKLYEENPVRSHDAKEILGLGHSKMASIKRLMGIGGARYVFLSDIRKFMRANPLAGQSTAYPRKSGQSRPERPQRKAAGKSGERSSKRGQGSGGPLPHGRYSEPTLSPQ